jgi:L-lactate dehydrogenase complex protein LldG
MPGSDRDSRAAVLAAVRAALEATPGAGVHGHDDRLAAARQRIASPPRPVLPERATRSGAARIAQFIEMVRFSQASLEELDAEADIPAAISRLCAARGLQGEVVLAGDNRLRLLDWQAAGVPVAARLVRSGDVLAVALADGGIAETGTLALRSGPASPSTANFLPEHHAIVVHAGRIHAGYEDYWAASRAGAGAMPRTVNWITGPSRSGDIELRMLMGAHGPLSVHVLLVHGGVHGGAAGVDS